DLLVLFADQPARLYRNDGNGDFTDVTAASLPSSAASSSAAALVDVDGDGDLDLLLAGQPNRLLLNNGAGVFTDVTATNLPSFSGTNSTSSIAFADVDGDADQDLCVGSIGVLGPPVRLFRNNGAGVFTDVTAASLPAITGIGSTAVAFADVDRDGAPDLLVA